MPQPQSRRNSGQHRVDLVGAGRGEALGHGDRDEGGKRDERDWQQVWNERTFVLPA